MVHRHGHGEYDAWHDASIVWVPPSLRTSHQNTTFNCINNGWLKYVKTIEGHPLSLVSINSLLPLDLINIQLPDSPVQYIPIPFND